ncbi:MAG: hypothetical protein Q8N30_10395 [Methylococcales bacterium]|jgi:hypothetical protein|nr:hypothetical protein [Methylococcales bacterium]
MPITLNRQNNVLYPVLIQIVQVVNAPPFLICRNRAGLPPEIMTLPSQAFCTFSRYISHTFTVMNVRDTHQIKRV